MQRAIPDIRIYDTPEAFRLKICGRLTEATVAELELCWHAGLSTLGRRALLIDLCSATAVDRSGMELLRRMAAGGAGFVAPTHEMQNVIREIAGLSVAPVNTSSAGAGVLDSIRRIARLLFCPVFHCGPRRATG